MKRNYYLANRGDYTVIALKNGLSENYFSYNPEFIKIFDEWHMSLFMKDGRLMSDCWKKHTEDLFRIYVYDLAYACYVGLVKSDTFPSDIQKFLEWKEAKVFEIDHADDNKNNNTVLNLSLMPVGLNRAKSRIVAKFIPPYYLNTAFIRYDGKRVGGEYRIQILFDVKQDILNKFLQNADIKVESTNNMATMNFICKDAESYVACLKRLMDYKYSWCNPDITPREHNRITDGVEYWGGDVRCSLAAQKILSEMDEKEFQVFSLKPLNIA